MEIKRITSKLLESNVYILTKNNEVLIVDCGCEAGDIKKEICDKKVVGILLTHGHHDHSCYCNDYAKEFSSKIYASKHIADTLTDKVAIYSENGETIDDLSHFEFIDEDKTIKIGNFAVECYYCPGHSACCECYIVDNNLFAGDVLFNKSIGRCDLKSSSKIAMLETLQKLEKLNFDDVYSGHGENSTKRMQLKHFPLFKKFLSR